MSHSHYTQIFKEKHFKLAEPEQIEPEYGPDWMAIEQEAMLMLDYWTHILELARCSQVLENLWEGSANG